MLEHNNVLLFLYENLILFQYGNIYFFVGGAKVYSQNGWRGLWPDWPPGCASDWLSRYDYT